MRKPGGVAVVRFAHTQINFYSRIAFGELKRQQQSRNGVAKATGISFSSSAQKDFFIIQIDVESILKI
jgi:hypothetical protein